jgi:hypothetical protein
MSATYDESLEVALLLISQFLYLKFIEQGHWSNYRFLYQHVNVIKKEQISSCMVHFSYHFSFPCVFKIFIRNVKFLTAKFIFNISSAFDFYFLFYIINVES